MRRLHVLSIVAITALSCRVLAQDSAATPPARFEVVSIKTNTGSAPGSSLRTRPDGGFVMTNSSLRSIINAASPEAVRDIQGLPRWVDTVRYDIDARPPDGSTRAQSREMMRNLLIDYFKVAGHVEQQERNTFALVLARRDGKLGPGLGPPSPECAHPVTPDTPRSPEEMRRCGAWMGPNSIEMGAAAMTSLADILGRFAGSFGTDRTGLTGLWSVKLRYSRPALAGAPSPAPNSPAADDAPELFTAIQEQLGLKLQPEKTKVPIFVIDHIERPTED